MNELGETVVQCRGCDKHFVHTKEKPECPYCNTEYGVVVEEKSKEKPKEKKLIVRTQKESFKMWKDNEK